MEASQHNNNTIDIDVYDAWADRDRDKKHNRQIHTTCFGDVEMRHITQYSACPENTRGRIVSASIPLPAGPHGHGQSPAQTVGTT
jgi:hypothetical protein